MDFFAIVVCIFSLSVIGAEQECTKDIYGTKFHSLSNRKYILDEVLAIWYPARAGSHNVVQLCSNVTGLPIERSCSHDLLEPHGKWDIIHSEMDLVDCSVITNNCVEESFEHYYVMKNNVMQKHTNKWHMGKIGELAKTQEPCLLKTGLPLTRKCVYRPKHYMAEWEKNKLKNTKCLRDINQDIVTYDLNKLYQEVEANHLKSDEDNIGAATKLTYLLTKDNTMRIPTDLEISTNILEVITQNAKAPALTPQVLEITNLLMGSIPSVVLNSNALGTPQTLLKTVETYFDGMANIVMPTSKCTSIPSGVYKKTQHYTSVFYINPVCSNISGIAVYSNSAHTSSSIYYDSPSKTYFRYLYLNESVIDIVREPNLEAASYIPESLWNTLKKEESPEGFNIEAVRFSLYRNTNFFLDRGNRNTTPTSVVLKISIPEYTGDLPENVPLIFQHHHTDNKENFQCGSYDYNTWNSSSLPESSGVPNIAICRTKRVKSFGALLGLNHKPRLIAASPLLTVIVDTTLDIISVAGSALSMFGLLCIWLTAICCKQWRSQSSTRLLLNVCFVLSLIMAYFLFINLPDIREAVIDMSNYNHCIAEGAFLQYMILVLFLWMLIIAILQYQRYVTVLGVLRPTNAIVKYVVIAWGVPLIPTALVVYLDPMSYMPFSDKDSICYPSGYSLYFAVLLPISVIMVVNVGIFLYILCSVRISMKRFKRAVERKDVITQVRLSILLFFLLGISWIFGILAHMEDSGVFSFLFCLTSTLQGFVLFIYFVVIDQSLRYSWMKYCCGSDYYTLEDSTMTRLNTLSSSH